MCTFDVESSKCQTRVLARLSCRFYFSPSPFFPSPPFTFGDYGRFSVAALPSADTLRPAPAVAALLNASGSEGSHRGPYQA